VSRASVSHVLQRRVFFSFGMAAPRATSRAVLRNRKDGSSRWHDASLPHDGLVEVTIPRVVGRRDAVRLDCAADVGNRAGTALFVRRPPACLRARPSVRLGHGVDRSPAFPAARSTLLHGGAIRPTGNNGAAPTHQDSPFARLGFGWHSCFRRSGRRNAMMVDGSRSIEPVMTKRDPGS
jgi:hypothetical protein